MLETKTSLNDKLQYCIGTEQYHNASLISNILMTDGMKEACEIARCYWFVDIMISYQISNEIVVGERQTWVLERVGYTDAFVISCYVEDSQDAAIQQEIPLSDFEYDYFKVFLFDNILLLPSEY